MNVKEMFHSMIRSYLHLTTKFSVINPKKVQAPPLIQCNNHHSNLNNPRYMEKIYKKVYSISKDNYKVCQKQVLRSLKKLMLEVGNNCVNIIEYIDFFGDRMKKQIFLQLNSFHNPWLLLQVLSSRSKFILNWGNFTKMGHYLGNLFAWYKIYSPKKRVLKTSLKFINLRGR